MWKTEKPTTTRLSNSVLITIQLKKEYSIFSDINDSFDSLQEIAFFKKILVQKVSWKGVGWGNPVVLRSGVHSLSSISMCVCVREIESGVGYWLGVYYIQTTK